MKKILKIFMFNVFLVVLVILLAEMTCIYITYQRDWAQKFSFLNHLSYIIDAYKHPIPFNLRFIREPAIVKNSSKKPIALMGCSFAYGLFLDEDKTPNVILSQYSNRTVYNLGIPAGSPREMLYILRNDEYRTKLFGNRTDFEYIIYPYISHHKYRLYQNTLQYVVTPSYKVKNQQLVYNPQNRVLAISYLYRKFLELRYSKINQASALKLHSLYMKEINREIKYYFPQTKFVILLYEDHLNEDRSDLEKEGIIVIKLTDILTTNIYTTEYKISSENAHPNDKAWELVMPALVKELNL